MSYKYGIEKSDILTYIAFWAIIFRKHLFAKNFISTNGILCAVYSWIPGYKSETPDWISTCKLETIVQTKFANENYIREYEPNSRMQSRNADINWVYEWKPEPEIQNDHPNQLLNHRGTLDSQMRVE